MTLINHFHSDNINYNDNRYLKQIYASHGFYDPFNQYGYAGICIEVKHLCQKANTYMPSLYLLDNHQIGALEVTTKPNRFRITLTSGALNRLDKDELNAMLAHEIGHFIIDTGNKQSLTQRQKEELADQTAVDLVSKSAILKLLKQFQKLNHYQTKSFDKSHYSDKKRINDIKKYDKQKRALQFEMNLLKSRIGQLENSHRKKRNLLNFN